jgi:hypothetical protein
MRCAEEAAAQTGLRVARLTVDLFMPIPLEPLILRQQFLRRGRRLVVLEASLVRPNDDDEPICSARAVLLAARDDLVGTRAEPQPELPDPADLEQLPLLPEEYREKALPGFHWSPEIRIIEGPASPAVWVTTPLDLVEGEPMTPGERLAALSDLTFVLCSRILPPAQPPEPGSTRTLFINTDTTIHLERPPFGRWLAFRQGFLSESDGIGLAKSTIHDSKGRVGHSLQTLLANG